MNFIPKIEYIELNTGLSKVLTFDSPPEGDPFSETYLVKSKIKRSTNGTRQVQWNYTLKEFRLDFIFQTEATKDLYKDFVLLHAGRGGSFNYFPSSDEVDFEVFEMKSTTFSLPRPIPAAIVGEFEYDLKFTIERVDS